MKGWEFDWLRGLSIGTIVVYDPDGPMMRRIPKMVKRYDLRIRGTSAKRPGETNAVLAIEMSRR